MVDDLCNSLGKSTCTLTSTQQDKISSQFMEILDENTYCVVIADDFIDQEIAMFAAQICQEPKVLNIDEFVSSDDFSEINSELEKECKNVCEDVELSECKLSRIIQKKIYNSVVAPLELSYYTKFCDDENSGGGSGILPIVPGNVGGGMVVSPASPYSPVSPSIKDKLKDIYLYREKIDVVGPITNPPRDEYDVNPFDSIKDKFNADTFQGMIDKQDNMRY